VTATIGNITFKCPTFTVIVANAGSGSSGGTKYPNLSKDTVCSQSVDINDNPNQICFTNYIRDLNNVCTLKYNWKTNDINKYMFEGDNSISTKTTTNNYTCVCPQTNKTSARTGCKLGTKWSVGISTALIATASCDLKDAEGNITETYSQSVNCNLEVKDRNSNSGSGSITASCSGTKLSAGKVRFSVTASSNDCSASNLKYN